MLIELSANQSFLILTRFLRKYCMEVDKAIPLPAGYMLLLLKYLAAEARRRFAPGRSRRRNNKISRRIYTEAPSDRLPNSKTAQKIKSEGCGGSRKPALKGRDAA